MSTWGFSPGTPVSHSPRTLSVGVKVVFVSCDGWVPHPGSFPVGALDGWMQFRISGYGLDLLSILKVQQQGLYEDFPQQYCTFVS